MDKGFEPRLRTRRVNLPNVIERQFAGQHHLLNTRIREPLHLLCRPVVHLRRGMDRHSNALGHPDHRHILNDERIDINTLQLLHHPLSLSQFVVVQQRVQRHIHPCTEHMRILHQPRDVGHRVASRLTRTKPFRTDIDGIGTVAHSLDAYVSRAGRGKKFEGRHYSILLMSNGVV